MKVEVEDGQGADAVLEHLRLVSPASLETDVPDTAGTETESKRKQSVVASLLAYPPQVRQSHIIVVMPVS